ncbi:MAG: hypothetical protein ACHQXG_08270 [Nitrososphaerales archaeon]
MFFNIYRRISVSVIISGIYILLAVQGTVSGYTGKEITLKLANAEFIPLNGTTNYQIKINVNYSVSDPNLIGQKVNAVMKVHAADGTVLKTTSFPSGFAANITGITQMLTNIPKIMARNITTEIVFMDLNKTNVLSNTVETLPHIANLKTSESMPTITNTT